MFEKSSFGYVLPIVLSLCACGTNLVSSGANEARDGGATASTNDAGTSDAGTSDAGASDAGTGVVPTTSDPFPSYCGPTDGGWTPPTPPTGTADCPSDKNLEGCPCTNAGQTASCWPGKRINRERGICQDGVTTCQTSGEFGNPVWGACVGAVLPIPSATSGKNACACFSNGQWKLENTSPCFISNSNNEIAGAVSTYVDGSGQARCPAASIPPSPQPGSVFSKNSLRVDCEGQFELCYTFKAGDADNPQPTDCVMARVCTQGWYPKQDVETPLPDLPAWSSTNVACINQFTQQGYAEMSVKGQSIYCEEISDSGNEKVFQRVRYCPLACNNNPSLPECQNCGNGASGQF